LFQSIRKKLDLSATWIIYNLSRRREMWRKVTVFLIAAGLVGGIYAQVPDTLWTRTFGGPLHEDGFSVVETPDSGYLVAGFTESAGAGSWDVYLVKADRDGNEIWSRTYGDIFLEYGYSLIPLRDGNYALAGWTSSWGQGFWDMLLLKVDPSGNEIWHRTYGGPGYEDCYAVIEAPKGGFLLVGGTNSTESGDWNVYLVRTNYLGDTIWAKSYGGDMDDRGYGAVCVQDGFLVVGATKSFSGGDWDVYILKIDDEGNLVEQHVYGGSGDDYGLYITEVSTGGYVVAGYTTSIGTGDRDFYIIKIDEEGDLLWERAYGGNEIETAYRIRETSDGGFLVVGYTSSFGSGFDDIYLIKLDPEGYVVWRKILGGPDFDSGYDVITTSDGAILVVGSTESYGAGGEDVYLIKLREEYVDVAEYSEGSGLGLTLSNIGREISLSYTLSVPGRVEITLYDLLGRPVRSIADEIQQAGLHSLSVGDLKDLPAGYYFLLINTPQGRASEKIFLLGRGSR